MKYVIEQEIFFPLQFFDNANLLVLPQFFVSIWFWAICSNAEGLLLLYTYVLPLEVLMGMLGVKLCKVKQDTYSLDYL